METSMTEKPYTWQDLKDFVNSIPKEYLGKKAVIVNPDVEPLLITGYFREPLYVSKHDPEDAYYKADFESELELGYIENPEDYEFDPSEPPFLTTDLEANE